MTATQEALVASTETMNTLHAQQLNPNLSGTPVMKQLQAISDLAFKTAMRQIASPVAVITARHGKTQNGLTATAVCSVSADPPTMLVCVNRNATAESLIAESGAFAINMLADDQHQIARLFSTSKLGPAERFGTGVWGRMETGSPTLEGAVACFDCVVEECVVSGSHNLYLGRVVAVSSVDQDILLYRDGLFRRLQPAG